MIDPYDGIAADFSIEVLCSVVFCFSSPSFFLLNFNLIVENLIFFRTNFNFSKF